MCEAVLRAILHSLDYSHSIISYSFPYACNVLSSLHSQGICLSWETLIKSFNASWPHLLVTKQVPDGLRTMLLQDSGFNSLRYDCVLINQLFWLGSNYSAVLAMQQVISNHLNIKFPEGRIVTVASSVFNLISSHGYYSDSYIRRLSTVFVFSSFKLITNLGKSQS